VPGRLRPFWVLSAALRDGIQVRRFVASAHQLAIHEPVVEMAASRLEEEFTLDAQVGALFRFDKIGLSLSAFAGMLVEIQVPARDVARADSHSRAKECPRVLRGRTRNWIG